MRDLWRATAMVVSDSTLRAAISRAANAFDRPDLANVYRTDLAAAVRGRLADLRRQPDRAAMIAIDAAFRNRGVYMSAYELAEMNRWFLDDRANGSFSAALQECKDAFEPALAVGRAIQSSGFLESVGVLVADPGFRSAFALGSENLRDNGFAITQAEEDALRPVVSPNSPGALAAQKVFAMGWGGLACLAAFSMYPEFLHENR